MERQLTYLLTDPKKSSFIGPTPTRTLSDDEIRFRHTHRLPFTKAESVSRRSFIDRIVRAGDRRLDKRQDEIKKLIPSWHPDMDRVVCTR